MSNLRSSDPVLATAYKQNADGANGLTARGKAGRPIAFTSHPQRVDRANSDRLSVPLASVKAEARNDAIGAVVGLSGLVGTLGVMAWIGIDQLCRSTSSIHVDEMVRLFE